MNLANWSKCFCISCKLLKDKESWDIISWVSHVVSTLLFEQVFY